MKPLIREVELLDELALKIKSLARKLNIPCIKLNIDYYSFNVKHGRVRNGICLYYTESTDRIMKSQYVWYTKDLEPINRFKPTVPGYLKLRMGGRGWYKSEHHLRTIGLAEPSGFFGARPARRGEPYAIFFRLPRGTIVYSFNPKPIEIYAEKDRLNLLFLLHTESPEYQPRSLDLKYEIKCKQKFKAIISNCC